MKKPSCLVGDAEDGVPFDCSHDPNHKPDVVFLEYLNLAVPLLQALGQHCVCLDRSGLL